MPKTQTVGKNYSKADIAKLKKISREIKEAKKSSAFRRAIEDFINTTT